MLLLLVVNVTTNTIYTLHIYMSQATRPPFSRSTVTLDGVTVSSAGAEAVASAGASLTRRRVSVRTGSRHMVQSIRAHTAALRSVAAARAICTQAITTRSRDEGLESSS